ncbi:MAG TPA: hypothetical protein VFL12_09945 [Thermoanaerobaculia bacterium]|nr:hypothetical protein [Thermoanaerobaculia bacterium]
MKARILVFLVVAAVALPAGARPNAPVRHVTAWAGIWHDLLSFVREFDLFDSSSANSHGLPPPVCTTLTSFQ